MPPTMAKERLDDIKSSTCKGKAKPEQAAGMGSSTCTFSDISVITCARDTSENQSFMSPRIFFKAP